MTALHVAAAMLCWIGVQPAQMTFTTLAGGDASQIEEPRQAVARTQAEWTALWKAHGGGAKPPAVDLARSTVIGVFLGTRPTAGYTVEITRIEKRDTDLVVTYREGKPAPSEMVSQVLTAPFHIVRTDSHRGPVRFQRTP
jgi:hypothetical protein